MNEAKEKERPQVIDMIHQRIYARSPVVDPWTDASVGQVLGPETAVIEGEHLP